VGDADAKTAAIARQLLLRQGECFVASARCLDGGHLQYNGDLALELGQVQPGGVVAKKAVALEQNAHGYARLVVGQNRAVHTPQK